MRRPEDIVAMIGLALGAVFGMAGTMVESPHLRAAFWALDSTGLVVAAALLAMKFFRQGKDFAAAGFLVFAIGEGVMLSGTALSVAESVPAFAAGTALWSAALLLISVPREFAAWIRVAGVVAAGLFAFTSSEIFCGHPLTPLSSPMPYFAYPFLVLNFIGWIWTLRKA